MLVHFILQVSSILRAEPNSRACGSAKMALFFFDKDNRVFLNQRMLCLPHTHQYPSEPATTHFLSVCVGPTYQEGWAGTWTGTSPQSTRIAFSFSLPSRLINFLRHFSHLLLHQEPIFLGFFTSPSSSFASKPHCIHIVLTSLNNHLLLQLD